MKLKDWRRDGRGKGETQYFLVSGQRIKAYNNGNDAGAGFQNSTLIPTTSLQLIQGICKNTVEEEEDCRDELLIVVDQDAQWL